MDLKDEDITLTQLAENFLLEIYNIYKEHKSNSNIHMGTIASKLRIGQFDRRVIDVTEILEAKGYINIVKKGEGGLAIIKINPNALIELERTENTKFDSNKSTGTTVNFFHNVTNSQINTHSNHNTQTISGFNDIDSLFEKLIGIINATNEIDTNDKNDVLADIAVIKHEITKTNPDKSFLEKRVELISKFVPLVPYVPVLFELIKKM